MQRKLLTLGDFRLYLAYRLCVTIAIQMQSVTVAWQVYELTHSTLHLGYVGLAIFLPSLLFSLPGGRAADHHPRRTMMLLSVLGLLLANVVLLLLSAQPKVSAYQIFTTLTLIGVARAFGGPATSAYLGQLVKPEELSQAVAYNSTVFQWGTIGGPALGGLLLQWFGGRLPWVYGVCGVLLSLGLLGLARLPAFPAVQQDRGLDLWGGIRFIRQQKILLGALSLDLFAVLLGGAVALLPVFARDILHVGASGLGAMRSAPALGAAGMALVLAARPIRHKVGITMLVSVLLFGIFTVMFGLSRHFGFSLFCLVMLGATDMISVVIRQTLIQTYTPDAMRGRVSAVNMVFIGASNELGEFESGVTAAWFGAAPAVLLGGVGTCLVVVIWSLMFRELRQADTYHPPNAENAP